MSCLRIAAVVAVVLSLLCGFTTEAAAQPAPPVQTRQISDQLARLQESIGAVPKETAAARWLPDVEVCAKAAEWILRHEEFYKPQHVEDTSSVLELGIARAAALRENPDAARPVWLSGPGTVVLGYRSAIDGSVQPYAVTLPMDFDANSDRSWPVIVRLHGRQQTLNEVDFIHRHQGKMPTESPTSIHLDVFGRTNNAYRWSGESDVFEALADVQQRFRIDERRITLWGFSMGGAGAWHLGLHHPSRWSSVGAGAGFVDFYEYQNQAERLPEYQDRTLHIYDAVDYATNAANVPFITYGGEQDKQLASSLKMKLAALKRGVPLRVLVGRGMGHKFDDTSSAEFMAFHAEHAAQGRPAAPGRTELRFITYTPKYNHCEWLSVIEMAELYAPATAESRVDDDGLLHLTTQNIDALSVSRGVSDRLRLDEQGPFSLPAAGSDSSSDPTFVRRQGTWRMLTDAETDRFQGNPDLHKRHNLQGPIDDAFMQPFVCVRGTGKPWVPAQHAWAAWTLARFEREFDKWLRGKVPVVDDVDITESKIADRNLVLFGDPGSNSLLSRIVDRLPIDWTPDKLTIRGQSYDPASHGVAMIFPNPLNPQRYVVINSGHTMHERDFRASNAWLFPKLGDIAVLKFEPRPDGSYIEETIWADLFDTNWKLSDEADADR